MATKVRFDGLDVQAMVAHLQGVLGGRRVVNIYDGFSGESYIFKLEGDTNKFLLMESGIRFHPLQSFSAESTVPSPFASKLRKHLRGLRIEKVTQIGQDRVVLFQFGSGEYRHCVILELYAKGNLILTDKDYTVLALLRSHVYNNNTAEDTQQSAAVAVQMGQVYPVSYATNVSTEQQQQQVVQLTGPALTSAESFHTWAVATLEQYIESEAKKPKKKKKKSSGLTLKVLLSQNHDSGVTQLGPALVEHCIRAAGLDPNMALVSTPTEDGSGYILPPDSWTSLRDALYSEGPRILSKIKDDLGGGYILCRTREEGAMGLDADSTEDTFPYADKIFEEFLPYLMKQHENRSYIECENFGRATEEYFERLQLQKAMQKAASAEKSATNRLEKVRTDQKQRLQTLVEQQESLNLEAQTVQMHAEKVDKALAVINSALDSGMSWNQLEQVVTVEQENRNPIALLIQELVLEEDAMLLRLPTSSLEYDDDNDDDETIDVKILLKETAHGNANILFDRYRALKEKAEKTVDASEKALKAAEETARRQLAEAQKRSKQSMATSSSKRKPFWFEKFHWFITSDNYLVLGGKDAHQNEQLVKRYLRAGDAYLHADVHGAASCVLRAKRRRTQRDGGTQVLPLSEQSLREAGNFTICRSSAWASRIVTSAWWVEAHQVSKTAPSGEYLTVGSFMIRGKKNYLAPSTLEMGLAVMFRLGDEDSIQRHCNERRDFTLLQDDDNLTGTGVEKGDRPRSRSPKKDTIKVIVEEENIPEPTDDGEVRVPDTLEQADEEVEPEISMTIQDEDIETNDTETNANRQKSGLSVRDRKLIKKYGSLEAAELAIQQQPKQNKKEIADEASANTYKDEPSRPKRGKKAKEKRAMRKYADQDEEDRELAMLALQGGSKSQKESKKKGSRLKHTVEPEKLEQVAAETVALLTKDSSEAASRLNESVRNILAECLTIVAVDGNTEVKWDKMDAHVIEQLINLDSLEAQEAATKRLLTLKKTTRVDNFSSSLGGIIRTIHKHGHEAMEKKQPDEHNGGKRKPKESKIQEEVEWKQQLQSEGIQQIDGADDAVDDTEDLNRLTGKPHQDDLLLSAVPVCAPYHTLHQYTYRVKLTPGSLKRGKASKQCVELFQKLKTETKSSEIQRQLQLIKQVGDNDWVQVICADVKIAAAGASKIAKKQKASKSRK